MASVWVDRLAEVWASPGHAGAGVVLGREGVLTARHVVADALGGDEQRILARVVRPGRSVAAWAPMRVEWEDGAWDLALLSLERDSAETTSWEAPTSGEPVVVQLGASVERHCEAVGFPESAVQRTEAGSPVEVVRQSEQAAGSVAPAGQGKPPVSPRRQLPRRWLPFDVVDTTGAGKQAGWGGMSGAGVILPDGRLIGIVVTAEPEHEERRLYLVPLADALSQAPTFAQRVAELAGEAAAVQARAAPLFECVCETHSLGPDGLPRRIAEIEDLGVFGVKPADLPKEPTYLAYVPRDDDDDLRRALREAIDTRRLLLVVGGSAAGKSRSTAEAVRDLLGEYRLLRPRADALAAVPELPLAEIGTAVVWLDDIQQYAHDALRDTLDQLLEAGLVVVGTIRRAEVEQLAKPGDVRNPAGDALTDDRLVREVHWRLEWQPDEQTRLAERVSHPGALEAVAEGVSLGAYVVAGPLLVKRLERARDDDEHRCNYALVRTAIDWYRTGINQPIPLDVTGALIRQIYDDSAEWSEIEAAMRWATAAEIGANRKTRQSLLTEDSANQTLTVHDYLLDHQQQHPDGPVANAVWQAALHRAPRESLWSLATAAYHGDEPEVVQKALEPFVAAGDSDAMFNLGVLLKDSDPDAGRRWYEQAAAAGDSDAMFNLGVLLKDSDPDTARRWYEQAAAAGHSGAMVNLGVLLKDSDPDAARRWYERAAAAGDSDAMFNLGALLEDSDPDAARRWWEQAAAAGDSDAMFNLGVRLEESDPDAARRWYEQAAAAGHSGAMNNLGLLLKDSDPDAARRWFEQAAAAGNRDAMVNLGVLLKRSDPKAARRWRKQARSRP